MNDRTIVTADVALPALMRATLFAAEKHRGQRRKDVDKTPYINHPIMVVNLLSNVGRITDVETLQAGMLHDTIEDTDTTADELEEHFGYEVRSLVLEVRLRHGPKSACGSTWCGAGRSSTAAADTTVRSKCDTTRWPDPSKFLIVGRRRRPVCATSSARDGVTKRRRKLIQQLARTLPTTI